MTLTAKDIEQIRAFVSKRGFTEPDLQLEIIDHVACRVEELMNEKPMLTLNEAIVLSHAEFGVMGFSVFEDAMRNALQQRYLKLFYSTYASYFNWKTVPLMVAVVYLVSIIFRAIQQPEWVFNITGLVLLLGLLLNNFLHSTQYKKYNKMLTAKMGNAYLVISVFVFNVYNIFIVELQIYKSLSISLSAALFAVLLIAISILCITIRRLQQHAMASCRKLEEKYPLLLS